jgi:hypothetical protein
VCLRVRACVGARALVYACARVALLIQHATRRHIAIFDFWLHHILLHYLINGTIFWKKVTEHKMCIFVLSTTFETLSHSKKNSARYRHNVKTSSYVGTGYSFRILITLEFSQQIFGKKNSNIKFHQNPSSGNRVVPCRKTAEHDEANGRFSEFCKSA